MKTKKKKSSAAGGSRASRVGTSILKFACRLRRGSVQRRRCSDPMHILASGMQNQTHQDTTVSLSSTRI